VARDLFASCGDFCAIATEFYKQLQQPPVTKAKTLQQAPVELLHKKVFGHPSVLCQNTANPERE